MPVQFLTLEQRARYVCDPTADRLTRYFHIDDTDQAHHGSLSGTFLEDPLEVSGVVLQTLVRQHAILQ